jgi:GT2 family glycosyltransferase
MNEDAPLVSVVLACFNGVDITRRCLDRVYRQDYRPYEVIVVDNGSTEDISGMVSREFPDAHLLRSETNLGFAAGYNKGMRAAKGKYVAIVNNDVMVEPQWLQALVTVGESDERVGAIASVVLDAYEPSRVDSCGLGIALDGMSRQARRGQLVPRLDHPEAVLLPSGSACAFRREALDLAGLFDEDFFFYCEDTDLGLRLRWAGYTAVVAPGAVVEHHYSQTFGAYSLKKVFWVERNHLWVVLKDFPLVLWPLLPAVTAWRFVVQAQAIATSSGDLRGFTEAAGSKAVAMTILRAYAAALAGAPNMLRKRHALATRKRITSGQMARLIWSFRVSTREIILGTDDAGK